MTAKGVKVLLNQSVFGSERVDAVESIKETNTPPACNLQSFYCIYVYLFTNHNTPLLPYKVV